MRNILLALLAAGALAACASGPSPADPLDPNARGTPGSAAFLGYHGPLWRENGQRD